MLAVNDGASLKVFGRRRRWLIVVAVASVSVICSCGPSSKEGDILIVCGARFGRAVVSGGDGPFYVDAEKHPPKSPITAAPGTAPIFIRVSSDCSTGASYTVTGGSLRVSVAVKAADGGAELLSVSPINPGQGRIDFAPSSQPSKQLTVTVSP